MSEPRRRCHLILDLQADSPLDIGLALEDLGRRVVSEGLASEGVSGGVVSGYRYTFDDDPDWTHDRYFDAIGELLAANPKSGSPRA